MITAERLRELLDYDPETGVFTWLTPSRMGKTRAGDRAGCEVRSGKKRYWVIRPTRQFPLTHAHRLAVLWMTGEWPNEEVDHRNGDGLDNRWSNLREATRSQNMCNTGVRRPSASGYRGVWAVRHGKFAAFVSHERRRIYLGLFESAEAAARAWDAEAIRLRGDFARLNFPVEAAA